MTERIVSGRGTCGFGSATDDPCRRPATEFADGEDGFGLCFPHAYAAELNDVAAEIRASAETVEARMWEITRWATERPTD